jgi:predicted nucleic acid-binding Zn ribbon protein
MSNTYIKKIKTNLAEINKTWEEFVNAKYRGGDTGEHYNYWITTCGNSKLPPHSTHCICGHAIERNQYIQFEDDIIYVLGSCCIKKYVTKSKRTCDVCGATHKTQTVNLCKDCKPIVRRNRFKKTRQISKTTRVIIEEPIEIIIEQPSKIITMTPFKKIEQSEIDELCSEFDIELWKCTVHNINIEVGYGCMDCLLR